MINRIAAVVSTCSNASPSQSSTTRPVAAASLRLRGIQDKPASLSQQIPPPPEPIGARPPEPLTPSALWVFLMIIVRFNWHTITTTIILLLLMLVIGRIFSNVCSISAVSTVTCITACRQKCFSCVWNTDNDSSAGHTCSPSHDHWQW